MPAPIGGDAFLAEASGYDGVKNAVVLRTADGLTIDIQDFRNKKIYKVISSHTGVIVQEAESRGVGCGCDALEPFKPSSGAAPAKAGLVGKSYDVHADPDTTVDILVAYDSNAKEWAMANGGITNFALVSVQKMNTVLANNNLDSSFRFRLVGVVSVPAYSYNLNYALESAANGEPGWEAISAMRDEVGADIVTVMIDTGTAYGTTGLGFSLYKNDYYSDFSWFEGMAYNACLIRSVAVSHTMTHEVGHNMGCGHSDIQVSSPGPQLYDYSAGYYFTAGGENYYTVMAYGTDGHGGEEAPYFSSPDQYYKGVAVGDSNHDNRRTLYNTYIDASQWRAAKGGEITTGEGDLPPPDPLTWQTTRAAAMSQAKAEGKKVFLISGSDTCWNTQTTKNSSCEIFAVKSILYKNYVCWYNNCDDQEEESRSYFDGYDIGYTLPFIAVIDPTSDTTLAAEGGYHDSDDLLAMLNNVETPANYTLRLHRNYSSGDTTTDERSMTYGKACALPKIETELKWAPRGGYSFVGWGTDADATTTIYRDGQNVKNLASTEGATVHLYAIWRVAVPSPFAFSGGDWTQEADGSWRSAVIGDGERTSASMTVTGPGSIFFQRKVSSEYQYDVFHFYIDGQEGIISPISGSTDWESNSISISAFDSVTFKWEYAKDDSNDSGDDCAWIKDVMWTPDGSSGGSGEGEGSGSGEGGGSGSVDPDTPAPVDPDTPDPVGPSYEKLEMNDINEPYSAPSAVILHGAVYDGYDVIGIVELKLGKAKKGKSKIGGSVTLLNGKKYTIKSQTAPVDGMSPAVGYLPVKSLGMMHVAIGGTKFAGSLGGWHVQSASVCTAWSGKSATASVEMDDVSAFSGMVLTGLLPYSEVADVNNGKWKFKKAAGVKWGKPKKGAAPSEFYEPLSGKDLLVDDAKGKTNLSGMKLSYTPKKGTFKGSFKLYTLQGSGKKTKLKKYTVKVSGVVVDGVGYGIATCKKPAMTWAVTVTK